jgi:hypothetical protein
MYAAGALVIIIVLALVVKPAVTGQPLNTGLPVATTPNPAISVTLPERTLTPTPQPSPSLPIPTVVPTWNTTVAKIGFVDPSTYGISLNLTLPNGTRIDSVGRNTGRVLFATIPGQYSATTEVIHIPFPYWEIWYTVEPAGKMGGKGQSLTSSTITGGEGSGIVHTVIQGSFAVTNPVFTLDVMDAADPNRIVRTITPPGGLDSTLWTNSNPRPWKEKFFEGKKDYFFVIKAHGLSSYTVEIMVPAEYIGKY